MSRFKVCVLGKECYGVNTYSAVSDLDITVIRKRHPNFTSNIDCTPRETFFSRKHDFDDSEKQTQFHNSTNLTSCVR